MTEADHPVEPTQLDSSLPSLPSAAKKRRAELETMSATETIGRVLAESARLDVTRWEGGSAGDAEGVDLRSAPDDLRYVRSLGQGGMGRVFLAQQTSLNRSVAVKTTTDPTGARALLAEAVITGMLEHPNIPPIHQLGQDTDGRPVLVMKRIEGATWAEILADPDHPVRVDNPLFQAGELDAHLEILTQVCSALQFAHARGVFHRDVKPANVMVGAFGEVMLIDWGIAFSRERPGVSEGEIVGSPGYMAPEMARGHEPDARTDVYLLGSTLHQVLTGRPRHDERNAAAALVSAVESAPFHYPPSVPSPLAALCNRSTSAKPEARPASALEFAQALRQFRIRRTASEITDRAAAQLRELEARVDADASPADYVDFTERAVACRFLVLESLRAWPDNPDAMDLRNRLHRVVLQRALVADDLVTARVEAAALRTAGALSRDLDDRLDAAERREHERIHRERELGLEMGRRSREALIAVIIAAIVPLQIYRWFRPWSQVDPARYHVELVWIWAFIAMPLFAGTLAFRRHLVRTAESRRLLGVIVFGFVAMGVHRFLAVVLAPGVAAVVSCDMLIMGAAVATSASWLGRPFYACALVFPVAALLATLHPAHAGSITNAATVIAALVFIWAQRRVARSREAASNRRRGRADPDARP